MADTATMTVIADLTGGTAFEAADAEQLDSIYDQRDARTATITKRRELTVEFMSAALVALVAVAAGTFV